MAHSIALFGGSFNPPGMHHRQIAARLSELFDEVLVIPCGPRPDKATTNDIDPVYRAALVDLNFADLAGVRVELFDLEQSTFTRAHALDAHYRDQGEIWHVVGTDLVQGGRRGESVIQRTWEHGPRLWRDCRFAVINRPGYTVVAEDLPPNSRRIEISEDGAGAKIRSRIFHRETVDELLYPTVARYIDRHGLYRGVPPSRQARLRLDSSRLLIVADERNPEAGKLAAQLGESHETDPSLIVVIGGDGTMLRTIREHWRRRVPFYGINAGHLGFLLNDSHPSGFADRELLLEHVPLLWVEMEDPQGGFKTSLAFNDAWVERATGQTAWIRVRVNGVERLSHLVADGVLVSTAAGSTSYARAMGATPLPLNTPALLLVGSNVLKPEFWKPAVLPLDSRIECTTLDVQKRPLEGYIDGVFQGPVRSMRCRLSNIAAVELAFEPEHDPATKLARIQFPPSR